MNPSISQKFVESLTLDGIEEIPCNCPVCRPARPEHVMDTMEFGCARMKALFESIRYHRRLLAASRPKPAPASSEVSPPPKENP
jgi:hypothetical protein